MSKAPREFQIVPCQDNTYQAFLNLADIRLYRAIHVIEKTPEVERKLECFDELLLTAEEVLRSTPDIFHTAGRERVQSLIKKAKGES